MNFGTFVCSRCSGIHRELNHKVKGIGVSNFTETELNTLNKFGNDVKILTSRIQKKFGLANLMKESTSYPIRRMLMQLGIILKQLI
jgi:hypothetical protein